MESATNQAWEVVAMTVPKPTVRTITGRGSFVLGRGSASNIQLHDASVSREHVRLTFGGPRIEVEDLGSANGTRLVRVVEGPGRGESEVHDQALRAHEVTVLPENATLQVGSVVVLVRRAFRTARTPSTDLIASSEAMKEVVQLLDTVAAAQLHVVLVGAPGVGRDLLARTLHDRSSRAAKPFVATQARARLAPVLERELFGVERDDQRGSAPPKAGLFEAASGGTLMIDAAETLTPALRTEVLRALSGRQITRLGARKAQPVDVRLVVGTSHDDSFCRSVCQLGGVTLAIPSLLERADDIRPLAEAFVARAAQALGRPAPSVSPQALSALLAYDFPHNVRELAEIMTRAVPLAGSGAILPQHLLIMDEDGSRELSDESEITRIGTILKPRT